MILFCNGEKRTIPPQSTIEQLIQLLELKPQGLAVAINDTIATRSSWSTHILAEGDRVTLIRAAQGG